MIFPNKSKPHAVRSTAVLTGSYVAGTVFSADEHNFLGVLVKYTKGDETSLQVKIESSIDSGTTYGQQTSESVAAGTSTVSLLERTFTATGNYWVTINPIKCDTIKISAKATGGGPTGTLGVDAITGWV